MPEVVVDAKDIDEFEADDKGRINLGIDNANATVEVALLDVDRPGEDDE